MKIFGETSKRPQSGNGQAESKGHQSIPSTNGRRRRVSLGAYLVDKSVCKTDGSFRVQEIRIWDLLNSYRKNPAGTHEGWIPAFSLTAGAGVGWLWNSELPGRLGRMGSGRAPPSLLSLRKASKPLGLEPQKSSVLLRKQGTQLSEISLESQEGWPRTCSGQNSNHHHDKKTCRKQKCFLKNVKPLGVGGEEKQCNCPSTGEQISKMWSIHTGNIIQS